MAETSSGDLTLDNLTHAVIGVLFAENALAFAPRSKEPSPRFRAEIYAVSVIGNNLPDLDVVYTSHFGPPPFGYLLQSWGGRSTAPSGDTSAIRSA